MSAFMVNIGVNVTPGQCRSKSSTNSGKEFLKPIPAKKAPVIPLVVTDPPRALFDPPEGMKLPFFSLVVLLLF